jgi:hypothetical protein
MGEETMSDIEKRIEGWRTALSGSQSLGSADINELESHLRDEIGHLQETGLSDVEAFLVARHRMGDAPSIEMEFAKINALGRLGSRIRWMMVGVLLFLLVTYFSSTVSSAFVWLGFERGLRSTNLAVFGGFVRVVAAIAAVLFALWLYAYLWRPHATQPISRLIMVFSTVVLVFAVIALYAIQTFSTSLIVENVGPQDFGSIAMAGFYADIAWRVLIPVLLMGWLAARHLCSSRRAGMEQ